MKKPMKFDGSICDLTEDQIIEFFFHLFNEENYLIVDGKEFTDFIELMIYILDRCESRGKELLDYVNRIMKRSIDLNERMKKIGK